MNDYPSNSSSSNQTTWILIGVLGCGGVAVLVCIVAVIVMLMLPVIGLTLMGPAIEQNFDGITTDLVVSADCQEETGLTQVECDEWINDLRANYSREYAACVAQEAENPNEIYECLIDEGLEPD